MKTTLSPRESALNSLVQVERRLTGDKAPDKDGRLKFYWNNYRFWVKQVPDSAGFAAMHMGEAARVKLVTLIVTGKLEGVKT